MTTSTPPCQPFYATPRNSDFPSHGTRWWALAALLGKPLTPWQQMVAGVAGEYDPDDGNRLRYPLVTVSVPRQCGKTTLFMVRATDAAHMGHQAWYTADNGLKARKRWNDWLPRVPKEWRRTVKRGAGTEVWEDPSGGRFSPFPPTRDAIHGEQVDWAGIDEAWSHGTQAGSELLTAIVPAQSTRPESSTWVASTAGDHLSEWWHGLVAAGRTGPPGHAHFEWQAPSDDAVLDPSTWGLWHPGYGNVLNPAKIPDLLSAMPNPDDAVRSFGNRVRLVTTSKWPPGAWAAACIDAPDPMPAVVALAVDVSPDRSRASVSAAHLLPDGRVLVQLLTVGDGTGWLVPEVERWLAKVGQSVPVAYDTKAQAAHVIGEAQRRRVRWEPVDTPGYVRACSGMYAAVLGGDAVVLTSPELDQAAGLAVDRALTDTWVWSRGKSPGDITPLVAASLAWHVATSPVSAAPRFVTRRAG